MHTNLERMVTLRIKLSSVLELSIIFIILRAVLI